MDAASRGPRPLSKQYVAALEARVASLEERLSIKSNVSTRPPETPSLTSQVPTTLPITTFASKPNLADTPPADPPNQQDSNSEPVEELTDLLGTFKIGDASELHYLGPTSNFNLNRNHDFKDISAVGARMQGIEAARQLTNFQEVSEDLRDHLLGLYWCWQNCRQYLVPQESFLRDLHVDKSSPLCTPLLLTTILAYASQYSGKLELRTNPGDPNTAGHQLYLQAKAILHCEYEAPATSTVQAAGLLGLYGAALDRESLGWVYVGTASRMAFSLGFHSDCSEYVLTGILSPEDADARNVARWGVYVLDRPACIQEYNITAPEPSTSPDNLSWTDAINQTRLPPFPTSHIATNAIYTCELFAILSEVLDRL
ncbi:fungal-specific transcription factor domain-containing protein [Halenospora varia]|nr:fungal-specific transcription factor domain-containing protein [Halenospora varia]